jgi:hypothetical protein
MRAPHGLAGGRRGALTAAPAAPQVLGYGELRLHADVARSVDALLAGRRPPTQLRRIIGGARALVRFEGGDGGAEGPWAAGGCGAGGCGAGGRGPPEGQWLEDLVNLARC